MSESTPLNQAQLLNNDWTGQKLSSEWNYRYEPNQLYPELMNVMSLNPFDRACSGARKQMFGSHIGQKLNIAMPTPRRFQTGAENAYGKATFNRRVDTASRVLFIVPLYNTLKQGIDVIKHNPETLVILEDIETGVIDCVKLNEYFSNHTYFGFKYKNTEAGRNLYKGKEIAAGTILQDSPAIDDNGNYCYGIELNVAFFTHPAVAEDGIVISEEIVPWLTSKSFAKCRVEWGSTMYPLNLYGDDKVYKPFPDIGDVIRPDGLVAAFREYDPMFNPVEMTPAQLREVNYSIDKLRYAGEPGARVIDLRVTHDANQSMTSPTICNTQPAKYDAAYREYCATVIKHYESMRQNNPRLELTHRFSNLVKTCYSVVQETSPIAQKKNESRIQKLHRGAAIDDWVVEFVIEFDNIPTVGYKGTDTHGGKGVFVKVMKTEDMPVDEMGNRVHMIMDPNATISRMNLGRFHEQFFNAASRDLTKEICDVFGVKYPGIHGQRLNLAEKTRIKRVFSESEAALEKWHRLMRYYEILTPRQHAFYKAMTGNNDQMANHLIEVMQDGIYIYFPTDNDPELPDQVEAIKQEFMPHKGKLTYRGNSGKMRTTKENILVGSLYIMLLEKTGNDWTAVSSGKLQNFGVLSQITNQDKNAAPTRQQAIRAWGETEVRIATAYLGPKITAEIIDRNNNILSHRDAVRSVLTSKTPTNIDVLVDRIKIPLGRARPLELIKHLAFCNGWEFKYKPYQEVSQKVDYSFDVGVPLAPIQVKAV